MEEFIFPKKDLLNVYRDAVLVWGPLNAMNSVMKMLDWWCLFGINTVTYLVDVCYITCTVVALTHFGRMSKISLFSVSSVVLLYSRQLISSAIAWFEPPLHIHTFYFTWDRWTELQYVSCKRYTNLNNTKHTITILNLVSILNTKRLGRQRTLSYAISSIASIEENFGFENDYVCKVTML